MDILYLHQYFVPPEGAGGTRSYELARRLVARGHRVTLITSSAMMPDAEGGRRELDGIELVVLPVEYDNTMSYGNRMRAFARFAAGAAVEATRHRADVVFATSTPLTIAIPGLIARMARRVPMVFEVRDLWPDLPIRMGALRNPVFRGAARALEWVAYHGAAHVVALSPGMADGVARRGIPRDRISIIPNGCDIELFSAKQDAVAAFRRERLPAVGSDRPIVLYAGTFGAINGVAWLADVAAAMRKLDSEVRFVVAGRGTDRDKIESRARELGVLDNNLLVYPPVPKKDMPLLLGCASVATSLFLPVPGMEDNSANKFFDALAAGKPVAINYGGWQAELLERTGAGIVMPGRDPAAAARGLHELIGDPGRLRTAGRAARALARERFDRDRLAEELEGVLVRAAGA